MKLSWFIDLTTKIAIAFKVVNENQNEEREKSLRFKNTANVIEKE